MAVSKNSEAYKKAQRKVERLKLFYAHLVIYLAVNVVLFLINWSIKEEREDWWFQWPAIGWGVAVVTHGLLTFLSRSKLITDWEQKKTEELAGLGKK